MRTSLSLFLLSLFVSFVPHDYHVSIYEIEIKDQSFQISMKLFADDFEKALESKDENFHFDSNQESAEFKEKLKNYILSKFKISIDGQNVDLSMIGLEWEDHHVMYLYFQSDELKSEINRFDIENRIFTEVSDVQQNMHRIQKGEKKISLLLERGRLSGEVNFLD